MVDHERRISPGDLPQPHRQAVLVHAVLDADNGDPQLVHVARGLGHKVRPPQFGRGQMEAVRAGEGLADNVVLSWTVCSSCNDNKV